MADINNIARNSTTIDSVLISQEYTTEKITNLLRTKNSDYRVIDNESGLSQVWTSFGLPAKTNELGHVHIIYGFASCKECKLTYSYESSKIGTTPLQRHICANKKTSLISTTRPTKKQRSSSCSSSSASTIIKINDTDTLFNFGIQKQITGTTKEIDTLKTLMVQWICGSLRPVSIVEDQGFIKLLQFAVNLGSKYNSFDINCLLRKRSVITNEITTVARQHREALKEQLTEPYLNRSLTLKKKNKKEANVQHQQVVVNIDGDDEENELNDESSDNADDDEYAFESPGLSYFRQRLLYLLENMFDLDDRHYAAIFLHPRYYSAMEYWTKEEKSATNKFIKKQLQMIKDETNEYSSSATESRDKKQNYGSEEEDNQYDELLNYHTLMLKEKGPKQDENPLLWWKSNETIFPMLSLLARRIFSISVTSASVERQFSQAGLVYCDRRSRTKPSLLNDMLLVRSMYKMGINDV
ncbi:unnamed protein product [Rotaria sp. Silwood1]|nr:unnamed protein product [Rotaria sp. Silwood1]CAF1559393.1 unnamed protein product [Rotaria sp. Silwood1]